MDEMVQILATLDPPALDAWLRQRLSRRLMVLGMTLSPPRPTGAPDRLGTPPVALLAGLARYAEIWVRWSDPGTSAGEALRQAAQLDADVVLAWLEAPPDAYNATVEWPLRALARLLGTADDLNLRDRCVFALAGPAASRTLARQAGFDEGFALDTTPAQIAATLSREAAAREELRRTGASPPCYL